MNLYWVSTIDRYEDWFVMAETKESSEDFYECAEGFNPGDAKAKFVCKIPRNIVEEYQINEVNGQKLILLKI